MEFGWVIKRYFKDFVSQKHDPVNKLPTKGFQMLKRLIY
jgi:hypothetical protein